MSAGQTVELLYFDGCPSHARLLPVVAGLADRARAELRLRRIETPEEAEAERFLGSPSVRVDGVDVDPGATGREDFGLKCRLYRVEGRQSATPPEAWIRAALAGGGDRMTATPIGYPQLRALLDDGAQLVEVLPELEYREEHLPGAINIPLKQLDADCTAQLDRRRAVVVYCWDAL